MASQFWLGFAGMAVGAAAVVATWETAHAVDRDWLRDAPWHPRDAGRLKQDGCSHAHTCLRDHNEARRWHLKSSGGEVPAHSERTHDTRPPPLRSPVARRILVRSTGRSDHPWRPARHLGRRRDSPPPTSAHPSDPYPPDIVCSGGAARAAASRGFSASGNVR